MEEPKAPPWYTPEDIKNCLKSRTGDFLWVPPGREEQMARHLTLAFNKGYSLGWRKAARDLELQVSELQAQLDRLKRAVQCYVEMPMEKHVRTCGCSACDLDRAMLNSPDFKERDKGRIKRISEPRVCNCEFSQRGGTVHFAGCPFYP